jgi:hypothetical protein
VEHVRGFCETPGFRDGQQRFELTDVHAVSP